MKQSTWDLLETDYTEFPHARSKSVTYEEIDLFAQKIGIKLAEDYREFIHRYGCGYIGANLVYGLRYLERGPEKTFWDLTLSYRKDGWPHTNEWVIISVDGYGNPFGMDAEGKVWTYDHDYGQLFDVGENFEDFILNECFAPDDDEEEGNEEDSDDE